MRNITLIFCLSFSMPSLLNAQANCVGIVTWDANTIYNDGDKAVYNNELYEANWWSQNQNPETNSGQYQVWTPLGICGASQAVKFIFPLEAPGVTDNFAYWNIGSYPDLDPTSSIIDYTGGTATYNNHHGTDIGLGANGWTRMDLEIVNVIAAADGEIVEKGDGEYDRRCGGSHNPGAGNYIKLEHADGTFTIYAHLKNGSLTSKAVGNTVVAGEYLGKVGSSGNSSGPHLHFDVRDANNNLIDPNHTDPAQSRWVTPLSYLPSAMPDIILSGEDISYIDSCGTNFTHDFQSEFFTRKEVYEQGDTVRIFRYYNNTRDNQSTYLQMIRPDGTQAWDWTDNITVNWQLLIMVSQQILAPNAQTGIWVFRETYNGEVYERPFEVQAVGTSMCAASSWSASEIYHTGDMVEYNGNLYEAEWSWIENQANPEVSTSWGAWSLQGACNTKKGQEILEEEVIVFPNPTNSIARIELKGQVFAVEVINSRGEKVHSTTNELVDMTSFSKGIYMLKIEHSSGVSYKRLVVE